jgi:hypothetical protein
MNRLTAEQPQEEKSIWLMAYGSEWRDRDGLITPLARATRTGLSIWLAGLSGLSGSSGCMFCSTNQTNQIDEIDQMNQISLDARSYGVTQATLREK